MRARLWVWQRLRCIFYSPKSLFLHFLSLLLLLSGTGARVDDGPARANGWAWEVALVREWYSVGMGGGADRTEVEVMTLVGA